MTPSDAIALQRALAAAGYYAGAIDGEIGPITRSAILRRGVIDAAHDEVGVREVGGDNRGPRVKQYQDATGNGPGDPWCASFVVWCADRATASTGVAHAVPRTGHCMTMLRDARAAGITAPSVRAGRIGDVGLASYGGGRGHAVILASPLGADGKYATIEGNTNNDGSRNGIMVWRHRRTASWLAGIVRVG